MSATCLQFDHERARMLPMTPEQILRLAENFLPDGAVALVDEAYEHDMLPKRPPGSKVPEHVKLLAKHRHRGLDSSSFRSHRRNRLTNSSMT
jgi:hypothetical protein